MASTAPLPGAQTIALQTLTTLSNEHGGTEGTDQHTSTQVVTQQATDTAHEESSVQRAATGTLLPPSAGGASQPPLNTPVPCPDGSGNNGENGPICRFLLNTPAGNALGVIGLVITLGLGLFSGIASYRDMEWSEHANAVQTCASLYSIGYFSDYCNSTIKHGIDATPLIRRWIERSDRDMPVSGSKLSPALLAVTVVFTTSAALLGTIFSRPRMRTFPPIISNVRVEVTSWIASPKGIRKVPGSKVTVETMRLLEIELAKKEKEITHFVLPDEGVVDYDLLIYEEVESPIEQHLFVEQGKDVDSRASSTGSSEILPTVQMAEDLHHPFPNPASEDIEHEIPLEGLEALVKDDLVSNADINSSPAPLVAVYFDRKGELGIYMERLQELDYTYAEGLEERDLIRDRGDVLEVTDEDFQQEFARRRQEIQAECAAAKDTVERAYRACIAAGIDPDGYRRSLHHRGSSPEPSAIVTLPPLVKDYFEAAGETRLLRERLDDLNIEHDDALATRSLMRDRGWEPSITSEDFIRKYDEERRQLERQLGTNIELEEKLKQTCIEEGLDVEIYLGPTSGIGSNSGSGQQEDRISGLSGGQVISDPANRKHYEPNEWTMVPVRTGVAGAGEEVTLNALVEFTAKERPPLAEAYPPGPPALDHSPMTLDARVQAWLSEVEPGEIEQLPTCHRSLESIKASLSHGPS